jgi:uncharacterized protein (DUF608 family)
MPRKTSPKARPFDPERLTGHDWPRTFDAASSPQVAFPLGGIGAAGPCINASGGLQDFSINHRPDTTARPDTYDAMHAAFGLLHLPGQRPVTRLLEGPLPPEKVWDQGLKGQGLRNGGHEGLPRFESATMRGEFPFAQVQLADPSVPLAVSVTAWSPFIPGDDRNSGLPCAIVEYTLRNSSRRPVDFELSFHVSDFTASGEQSRSVAMGSTGVSFENTIDVETGDHASACLAVVGHKASVKGSWLRGAWFDAISALWREVSTGGFRPNKGTREGDSQGRNGGSVLVKGTVEPGGEVTVPFVIAWHWPTIRIDPRGAIKTRRLFKTWYAGQWANAREVAMYVRRHYQSLRARSDAFREALHSCTLPGYVIEAVSANLGILRSPTVLRGEDGAIWAWEGCRCDCGCCEGSCTHVWNYAQALPALFPALERSLREQEYQRSMNPAGHVDFRLPTPDVQAEHAFRPAADGQLGGIVKLYREWRTCGDRMWAERLYPLARLSLEYCINTWDPERRGEIVEPHHNTYDIEFWGADGMCTGMYCAALSAMAALARDLDEPEDAAAYEELAGKAARRLDEELFNGRYYFQKVQFEGLRDTSFVDKMAKVSASSPQRDQLLKREGPPYQYGDGCLADGVIGPWMAALAGVGTPQSQANIRKHLASVFAHNFRPDLFEHANTQRPGYALGHEAGLLICTWPNGSKPTLPFPYSDEIWTGIEYEVASFLIHHGLVDEGLTIVRAIRDRHEGRTRNPWCEYECGNYYARAMASYALLWACSGLHYDKVGRTLHLSPRLGHDRMGSAPGKARGGAARAFRTFLAADGAFGNVSLTDDAVTIELVEGRLAVRRLVIDGREIACNIDAVAGKPVRQAL